MSHASALRLAHALPLAFGLAFIWPEAADAGLYNPQPLPDVHIETPPAAPPRLLPTAGRAPNFGVDGEGRNVSMAVPAQIRLYGVARAEDVAARTVIETTGAGTARLGFALDGVTEARGTYVGVVAMIVDYN